MTKITVSQEKNKINCPNVRDNFHRNLKQKINPRNVSGLSTRKQKVFRSEYIVNDILNLKRLELAIFDVITGFSVAYDNNNIIPSQKFIAVRVGCTVRTVNKHLKTLHDLGLINKTSRGWKLVDPKSNTYKSKTCDYKLTKCFEKNMRYILRFLPKFHPLWRKLYGLFPSCRRYIGTLFLLSLILLNTSYSKEHNYLIKSNEITIFGQNDYEVSKRYKKGGIFPRTTASVQENNSYKVPETHEMNVYDAHYKYNKYNIKCIMSLLGSRKKFAKVDLRFCTESLFKQLSEEQQKIASSYHDGKNKYGSVHEYETHLQKSNLRSRIWKSRFPIVDKAPGTLKKIKQFPRIVLEDAKRAISKNPAERQNYEWIYDYCVARCKMRNLSIREVLNKNGFHRLKVKPSDNIKPKATQVNERFRKLIGDDVFNKYVERINKNKEKQ